MRRDPRLRPPLALIGSMSQSWLPPKPSATATNCFKNRPHRLTPSRHRIAQVSL